MAFFENFPWTNYNNINLNQLVKKMDYCENMVKEFSAKIAVFEGQLAEFDADLSNIKLTLAGVETELDSITLTINALDDRVEVAEADIEALTGRVNNIEDVLTGVASDLSTMGARIEEVNTDSITRDNNLGNRISLLESAVINPIDVYNSAENLILAGDYLQYLPKDPNTNLPYNVVHGHNNNWLYDEKGFYSSGNWTQVIFKSQYSIPTSGGGGFLAFPVTVTIVFMRKNQIDASAYNVSNPSFWLVDEVTFTSAGWWANSVNVPGLRYQLRSDGMVTVQNMSAGDMTDSYRLVAIKAEKGETSTGVVMNVRDKLLMDYAKTYADAVSGAGAPVHFTGSIEFAFGSMTTVPEVTWADGPYMTAGIDLYKDGNIVSGKIGLVLGSGQSEAITMTEPTTTPKTIDVSSLNLPKASVIGQPVGAYYDIVSRIQYIVYANNGANYLSSFTLHPFFVSETTSASGGVVDIPISYPC